MIVLYALLLPSARAQGWSADIELVRPTFGSASVGGIDSALAPGDRALRVGLFSQYELNPLVLNTDEGVAGSVVGQRVAFDLGVSVDATDALTLRLQLPGAAQWGSTLDTWSADTGGLRDASAGLTVRAPGGGGVKWAGRADLIVPTGARDAWLGESTARVHFGGIATVDGERLDVSLELGLVAREKIATDQDFTLGTELAGGAGLIYDAKPGLAILGALQGRAGFYNFFGGGAEYPLELLAGARIRASDAVRLDAIAGHGIGGGYGATDARVAIGVTWQTAVEKPEEPAVVEHVEEVDEDDLEDAPDKPEPVEDPEFEFEKPQGIQWKDDELARQIGQRIEIRDPIRFAAGTETVLAESLPTLETVASLLQAGDLLVIEGHASEDGEHAANYALSVRRAQSVAEELEKLGLPPERLSWRGMGETRPAAPGSSEAERAQSRRVVFYVVRLEGEAPPTPPQVILPWDGSAVPARAPAPPQPEKKEKR